MRLYYAPGTISIAVAITLEETALPYEAIKVDFKSGEQSRPDYLAINPKGRVPTLEVDGEMLTETGALLEYIATRAPEAELVPQDPMEAARMRSVMYYLASTMHVNHAHSRRGHRWADKPESHEDMAAKVPQTMTESARYISEHCLRGDFILGDNISLADPYCFVVCNWLEPDGVDLGAFPSIAGYLERMRERPSVQAVIAKGMLPG
jgi:glutathione S-transferase